MTDKKYEQIREECLNGIKDNIPFSSKETIFKYAFDRAYALGKQTEAISHEDLEKVAEEYVYERQKIRHYAKREEDATMRDFDKTVKAWDSYDMAQAFESGANIFIGRQKKDEDTVISGWVAIDEAYGQCFLHTEKPIQKSQPIADTGDYDTVWDSKGKTYLLDTGLFPDMDSESDPEPVEIIIKRKKNG